jgi:nicotinamidase-related amidase
MERSTLHTPTPEEVWATQAGKLDFKKLLAEGAHLHHVDDTCGFFPEDPNVPGTGELPGAGAESIIDPINAVTPYFGENQIGLYDSHPQEGTAYSAATYRALGLPKDDYSELTLNEFQDFRRAGTRFPFDADRFEQFIEASGGKITLWPLHTRKGTPGEKVHPGILTPPKKRFLKGETREIHHFGSRDTYLEEAGNIPHLLREKVKAILGVGLLEDYCLGIDLLAHAEEGIQTLMLLEGTVALNAPVSETETTQTIMREKLVNAGVIGITLAQFLEQVRSKS